MNQKSGHGAAEKEAYTVERRFQGERTAEEVVAALIKAHR